MTSVTDPWDDTMPVVIRPDLTRLAALLCEREYSQHAREHVLSYARDLGTLEGCPWVDPGDRADLDAILEDAWPAVPQTSSAWDESPWEEPRRQPVWTLERRARIAALYEAHGATLTAEGDDDAGEAAYEDLVPPELDLEPYEPTEEDELDYAAWVAAHEADLAPEPEVYPIRF